MIYLLDTHYMLWTIADSGKLSKKVKEVITDPENSIIVSTVSFWEVSLKSALGKLQITRFLSRKTCRKHALKWGLRF
jgi:PIN domain nuclease of toxin-antitoxin system